MRPTHSQMITLSDDMRANIAGVPALIVSGILVLGFDFDPLGSGATVAAPLVLPFEVFNLFLVFWPLFALTYLLWTHAGLRDLDETELIARHYEERDLHMAFLDPRAPDPANIRCVSRLLDSPSFTRP